MALVPADVRSAYNVLAVYQAAVAASAQPPASAPAQAEWPPKRAGAKWMLSPVGIASPDLTQAQLRKVGQLGWMLARVPAAVLVEAALNKYAGLHRITRDEVTTFAARWGGGGADGHVCGRCDDPICPLRDVPGWGCRRFATDGVCARGCPFPHVEATVEGELWLSPLDVDLGGYVSAALRAVEAQVGEQAALSGLVAAAADRMAVDRAARAARMPRRP